MLSGHFLGFFFGRDILHPLNVFLNSYRRQQYVGFRVILVLFLLLLCPVHEEGLAVLLCCSILKQNLWKVLVLPHRWTLKSNLKLAEESVWFYRLLVFWLEKLREKKQRGQKKKIPGTPLRNVTFGISAQTCICFSCTIFKLAWITLTFLFTFLFNIIFIQYVSSYLWMKCKVTCGVSCQMWVSFLPLKKTAHRIKCKYWEKGQYLIGLESEFRKIFRRKPEFSNSKHATF